MSKCPACGYTADTNANYSKKIGGLLRDRSPATRKLMNKIAGKINKNVPSETRIKYFQFLYGIKDIDDEVIVRSIDSYYRGKHYYKGKGFSYLRTIIQTRQQNSEKIKENERRMLGIAPPIINHEKGDTNE